MASKIQTRLFINNEYIDAKSTETLDIYNPADDSLVVNDVQVAGQSDIDGAVAAAAAAFKTGPWSKFTGQQRAACMLKLADLIERDAEKLAKLETVAMGVPIMVGKLVLGMAPVIWRYYAGFADKITGQSMPPQGDELYKIVRYEPHGVCAGIGAWNGTPYAISMKMAPALAAGNTFIYKASEKAPLSALAWGELFIEAGFPAGVANFVTGGASTGALLASHMGIAKISFTGSIIAGRKVNEAAIKSNLKRCTLELGGKSATLIFNDADIENALVHSSQSFLANSGQACVAGSRALVQEDIAPKFTEALKARFEGLSNAMGDTMNPQTFLGPVADKKQFTSVMGFIEDGKKSCVPVVGGSRKGEKGCYIEPTLFVNPPRDSKIFTQEIFGPVLTLTTFKTEEEAIEIANDTTYGLSAQIYSKDITRILRVAAKLECGNVGVNTFHNPNVFAPFGGTKQSGIGREAGEAGLMSWLESKTISINMNAGEGFGL